VHVGGGEAGRLIGALGADEGDSVARDASAFRCHWGEEGLRARVAGRGQGPGGGKPVVVEVEWEGPSVRFLGLPWAAGSDAHEHHHSNLESGINVRRHTTSG
jgi:hypothetical protein